MAGLACEPCILTERQRCFGDVGDDGVRGAERSAREADAAGACTEFNDALARNQVRVSAEVARQHQRGGPQSPAGAVGLIRHVSIRLLFNLDGVGKGGVGEARHALGYVDRAHVKR